MQDIDRAYLRDWQHSRIWNALNDRTRKEADDVCLAVGQILPDIQHLLSSADTSPPDFTLHDSQHSFRVAERMAELAGGVIEAMSAYELAFLLLSAYLHDMGMSPPQRYVDQHFTFALCGRSDSLSQRQIDEFISWLDFFNASVPLAIGEVSPGDMRRARFLVSHYCREKHVDWTEDWIESHLTGLKMGSYHKWVDDLKALCRSHHEGYDSLSGEAFAARIVGKYGQVVHLRYLACLLRLADILEFSPDRTPDVILQHRDIHESSVVYWHKDQSVSCLFENNRITLVARPTTAYIHRAIEDMVLAIEGELTLVRRLNDEQPFWISTFQNSSLYHRWDIDSQVRKNITPHKDLYEYVDGAFRPDTDKLLQLLSGVELYGDALVAVRELLQNAFDAVKEQMAYERLARPDPSSQDLEGSVAALHQIVVALTRESGGTWLTCRDTGAGMSKSIIINSLLVSGNTHRADINRLRRRCVANKVRFNRTGKFGLGVLSYFMLADRLQIRTRRSSVSEGTESTGWHFETDGVGSFGELRKDVEWKQGTEIKLRIRAEKEEACNELVQYMARHISMAPCDVIVSKFDERPTLFGMGWSDYRNIVVSPVEIEKNSPHAAAVPMEVVKTQVSDALRWKEIHGDLPNGLGAYRLSFPTFDTSYGLSPAFFLHQSEGASNKAITFSSDTSRYFFLPDHSIAMSWYGISVYPSRGDHGSNDWDDLVRRFAAFGVLQVDWRDEKAGSINIARDSLALSEAAVSALEVARESIVKEVTKLFCVDETTPLGVLQLLYLQTAVKLSVSAPWLWRDGSGGAILSKVRFPLVDHNYFYPEKYSEKGAMLRLNGQRVTEALGMHEAAAFTDHPKGRSSYSSEYWAWCIKHSCHPDRLVEVKDDSLPMMVTVVWDGPPRTKPLFLRGFRCKFPPKWRHAAVAVLRGYTNGVKSIWNVDHAAVGKVEAKHERWVLDKIGPNDLSSFDPRKLSHGLLKSAGRMAAWLCLHLAFPPEAGPVVAAEKSLKSMENLWRELAEDGVFMDTMWSRIGGADCEDKGIVCLDFQSNTSGSPKCWFVDRSGFHVVRNIGQLRKIAPYPGDEWLLSVVDSE